MLIKDTQGLYEIKVDTTRRIAYQTHFKGLFTAEALERLDNDYKKKVIPMFKGQKWSKLCDLRDYTLGNIVNEMNVHNEYCIKNGMADVALVVESAIVKIQMNRGAKAVDFAPTAFTDVKEADEWLKSKGY